MFSSSCRMAVHLALLAALLCSSADARPRVDCTKFVYAPSCRGVAAKRALLPAERDVFGDIPRKLSGLEQLMEMYATAATLDEPAPVMRNHESEMWSALVEQASKPEALYDWYLSSLKRSKEGALYDY
ncbi:abdominal ganglion neuropeptide L11-like [Bacillus rossius redtenbacheri]|uniref:abdominal ganglion neuropeptide L11-like n=1 Tax=Bacillus rossius redtenbacheri TaxID=93214 RepID=UPI002FDEF24B